MNAADQIAAINRKAEDEHRAVDLKRDKLIQQVRGRCKHSRSWEKYWHRLYGPQRRYSQECRHCGEPWPFKKRDKHEPDAGSE